MASERSAALDGRGVGVVVTASAMHASDASALLFRFCGRLGAVPVGLVLETMRPLPVEGFAGATAFVSGLAVIRGVPTPVVDLGGLLGGGESAPPGRFITVKAGGRAVALAVDSVVGLRALPSGLGELPPLLGAASPGAVSAVAALDGELLAVLDAARLVPDSVWSGLAGGEAT